MARTLRPGDNLVLSRACHDANIAPWLLAARDAGAEVRWLSVDSEGFVDPHSARVDGRTRVVAAGLASNACGAVHALGPLLDQARAHGALSVLDGTHFVPHRRCDLGALGGDVVVASAYKFCGPHVGVLGAAPGVLERLRPYKVGFRADGADLLDYGPPSAENCQISPWEMGTLNYEGLAGFEACVEHFAAMGGEGGSLGARLDRGFRALRATSAGCPSASWRARSGSSSKSWVLLARLGRRPSRCAATGAPGSTRPASTARTGTTTRRSSSTPSARRRA